MHTSKGSFVLNVARVNLHRAAMLAAAQKKCNFSQELRAFQPFDTSQTDHTAHEQYAQANGAASASRAAATAATISPAETNAVTPDIPHPDQPRLAIVAVSTCNTRSSVRKLPSSPASIRLSPPYISQDCSAQFIMVDQLVDGRLPSGGCKLCQPRLKLYGLRARLRFQHCMQ